MLEKLSLSRLTGLTTNNSGAIGVNTTESVIEEKSYFKMLGLSLSSKLDLGLYIVSIAKTTSQKIGALIHSMKFLSPEVAFYLYKSTIRPQKNIIKKEYLFGILNTFMEMPHAALYNNESRKNFN